MWQNDIGMVTYFGGIMFSIGIGLFIFIGGIILTWLTRRQ